MGQKSGISYQIKLKTLSVYNMFKQQFRNNMI